MTVRIGKITQVYQKNLIDITDEDRFEKTYELDISGNTEEISEIVPFEYKINLPVDSLEISNHFIFQNKEEEYSFLFEDYVMEIFGHSPSSEYTTFNDLNDVYVNLRDKHDFIVVSDEIGKSKPASLFFLSKFGCQLEKVVFYSNYTINSMWDEIDILLTSNPSLLLEHPSDKLVIKFETEYNKKIESIHTITTMKEFEEKLKEIIPC